MDDDPRNPEQLLYTDEQGNRTSLDEVMYRGMDGRYHHRVPALRQLMRIPGDVIQQFNACYLLASWGDVEGLWQIAEWAGRPDHTPWGDAPFLTHRLYGTDQAYEQLAQALLASLLFDKTPERQVAQIAAAKALLGLASSYVFDYTLQSALVQDDAWLVPQVRGELRSAVEDSVRAIEEGRRVGFILEIQTGTLLWVLAGVDDAAAAEAAERWLAALPDDQQSVDPKVLGDVLGALENGGHRCLALLERYEAHHARPGS